MTLALYCGLGGLAYYPRPEQGVELERFLDRCAEAGVDELVFYFGFVHAGEPTVFRLVPTQRPFEPADLLATFHLYKPGGWAPWAALVHGARSRGLRVTGYTSPNYQGATLPNPHSPLGEQLPFLFLSEFANGHPEFWVRDRAGHDSLAREGYVLLNLTYDAVRDHLVQELCTIMHETELGSLELEWLGGAGDGSPYVHSAPKEMEAGITTFVGQVRRALDPDQHLSVAVDDSPERARAWCYDWPAWATSGLVERVVLRHRGQNLAQMAARVRRARALLGPQVELVSQLDCWREDGLREGKVLSQAMDLVRRAGADSIGIYRADAVEALALWQHI